MKAKEVYHQLLSFLPLADIKTVFDGYFTIPFDSLLLNEEKEIEDKKAVEAIKKLKQGYPANYLAGYINIAGLHLFLNKDTLIPRTETEDFVLNILPTYVDLSNKNILDLCTGGGFIACAVKKRWPTAKVIASDISDSALDCAKKSAFYNHLDITFLKSDFLKYIPDTFDVILSNPPYIEEDSKEVEAPFEPRLALYSGKDGLDSYRAIFTLLDSHLNVSGRAYFEIESTNKERTIALAKAMLPSYEMRITNDLYNRPRYLEMKKA